MKVHIKKVKLTYWKVAEKVFMETDNKKRSPGELIEIFVEKGYRKLTGDTPEDTLRVELARKSGKPNSLFKAHKPKPTSPKSSTKYSLRNFPYESFKLLFKGIDFYIIEDMQNKFIYHIEKYKEFLLRVSQFNQKGYLEDVYKFRYMSDSLVFFSEKKDDCATSISLEEINHMQNILTTLNIH